MLSFVAAVKVAQWVAKAYGYVALKRREYIRPSRVSTSMVGKCAKIRKIYNLEKSHSLPQMEYSSEEA